jgi:hypothetical protein
MSHWGMPGRFTAFGVELACTWETGNQCRNMCKSGIVSRIYTPFTRVQFVRVQHFHKIENATEHHQKGMNYLTFVISLPCTLHKTKKKYTYNQIREHYITARK